MALLLETIPCLADNYAYLLHDEQSGETALVDAPEVAPILARLSARNWSLTDILLTHHHHDHVGGVDALRAETGARVLGAKADRHRLPNLDREVEDGDHVHVCGADIAVIDVPGHTVGHVAFHLAGEGLAFTGDSLMALGCGRLFEGTAAQMWDSLSRLAELPDDTQICSGHEYAAANARFALTLESDNPDLEARAARITSLRSDDQPTVPVSLAEERATNPFLRASIPAVKAAVGLAEAQDVAVFAEIRRRKDTF